MSNTKPILLGRIFFLCLLLLASAGCTSNRSILARIADPNNVIGSIAQGIGGWRSVLGPTGEAVNVYPMHEGSVQSSMENVSRLQRAGDGFLLMYIDDKMAPLDSPIDYVEITPGTKRIVLAPGQDAMFSYEMTDEIYFLVLEIKPNAWYIFRTRILEEGHKTEPVVRGTMKETKRQVTLAPFEVIEILNGSSRTVATTRDFHPME